MKAEQVRITERLDSVDQRLGDIDSTNLNSYVHDALAAVIELYQDMGKQFPANLRADNAEAPEVQCLAMCLKV
jgi:hypothetical protein